MLTTNLSHQSLNAFSNIHNKSIVVFGHMWMSLRHIMSYSKANAPHNIFALTKLSIFVKPSFPSEGYFNMYNSNH